MVAVKVTFLTGALMTMTPLGLTRTRSGGTSSPFRKTRMGLSIGSRDKRGTL